MKHINNNYGFAFIGILVAVAVAGIVGMFAASTYLNQSSDNRLLDNTVSRIVNDIQALIARKDNQQTQIEFVNGSSGSYYSIKSGNKDAVKVDLPPGTRFAEGSSTQIVLDPSTGKPMAPATIGIVQNVELQKGIVISSDGNVSATAAVSGLSTSTSERWILASEGKFFLVNSNYSLTAITEVQFQSKDKIYYPQGYTAITLGSLDPQRVEDIITGPGPIQACSPVGQCSANPDTCSCSSGGGFCGGYSNSCQQGTPSCRCDNTGQNCFRACCTGAAGRLDCSVRS